MRNLIYVDSQSVVLLDGQRADIDLEYDENKDIFVVTADAEDWIDDMKRFASENHNDDDLSSLYDEARRDCKKISGKYFTLKEINQVLERYCNDRDWYEFSWQYEDGTEVE